MPAETAVSFVFAPPPVASVAVQGQHARYAVRRIFCVGRNYAAHAREMGGDPQREPPFYFNKAPAHLIDSGAQMAYPLATADLHHEVELVVALGAPLVRATPAQAAAAVWGCACGLDMTRRDLQDVAKKSARPWDSSKDFEDAAVIGPLRPLNGAPLPARGGIWLDVNGVRRQQGDLADQIWPVPEMLANLSTLYRLGVGDLVLTGTPAWVGAVRPGDVLAGGIDGVGQVALTIAPPR